MAGAVMRIMILVILLVGILPGRPVMAQQEVPLHLLQSVTGDISQAQAEQRWAFDAAQGQLISVRMQATSGNLNPYMELIDVTGKVLAKSTSSSFGTATINAFTIPQAATYNIRAARAPGDASASGSYALSL